jgi:hypothetical protein
VNSRCAELQGGDSRLRSTSSLRALPDGNRNCDAIAEARRSAWSSSAHHSKKSFGSIFQPPELKSQFQRLLRFRLYSGSASLRRPRDMVPGEIPGRVRLWLLETVPRQLFFRWRFRMAPTDTGFDPSAASGWGHGREQHVDTDPFSAAVPQPDQPEVFHGYDEQLPPLPGGGGMMRE